MSSSHPHHHQKAFDEGFLAVSNLHKIHYEQYGKKDGKPVIFLHGGPGGSATYQHAVFFDQEIYRVVLFDQRGAGKSEPAAEIRENTSAELVSDIERLREHFHIERWFMVFGGSWGSMLSLLYAQAHPQRVRSIVVRGVYTGRKAELNFSRGPAGGAARINPEVYKGFSEFLPVEARADPIRGYHALLTCGERSKELAAAKMWNRWDGTLGLLIPGPDDIESKSEQWHLQHARIETYYHANGGFVPEGHVLAPENLEKIRHIPCSIVNGRYDLFCPPQTAVELHQGLPMSKLYIIPAAGHSMFESGIKSKLIEICDEYAHSLES